MVLYFCTLGSIYFDVKWFSENNFRILRCLLQRKIGVKGKYFSFDRKFFFNFQKMVYGFENRKPFFDLEHLIFKLIYLVKARLGPCRGLLGTSSGLARNFIGTHPELDQDLTGTPRTLPRLAQARDFTGTYPRPAHGPARDFTETCPGPA